MSTIPTVYFIDDSATMREVIKIAFRRENINVVACHDAATALAEIETAKPDIVITDVIMPDKDGYDVCQHIKSHPALAKTPVILMSGVVNRAVAERAFAVKADELLRKPFQPQDLITRVKHLLKSNGAPVPTPAAAANAAVALSSIFLGSSSAHASAFCSRYSCADATTRRRGRRACSCSCNAIANYGDSRCSYAPAGCRCSACSRIDSGCSACGSPWEWHDAGRSAVCGKRKRLHHGRKSSAAQ